MENNQRLSSLKKYQETLTNELEDFFPCWLLLTLQRQKSRYFDLNIALSIGDLKNKFRNSSNSLMILSKSQTSLSYPYPKMLISPASINETGQFHISLITGKFLICLNCSNLLFKSCSRFSQ